MIIKIAKKDDIKDLTAMALKIFHGSIENELIDEFSELINNDNACIYIAQDNNKIIGFVQCQLRFDYVEGTKTSPVGYIEGIFVENEYRKRGIARELIDMCEIWCKNKGCFEIASDCELLNTQSINFHLKLGFEEANRIVCFKKDLK